MELLSTWGKFFPNYKCDTQDNLAAVIGGPTSDVCLFMADILRTYKFSQITYGSAPLMDNKKEAVFFHNMFPSTTHQYTGILDLILHFQWKWIGLVYFNREMGERFVHKVLPMFMQKDESPENICTQEEKLETLPMSVFEMSMTSHSYNIYNSVYAIAHALHDMDLSKFRHRRTGIRDLQKMQPWQVKFRAQCYRIIHLICMFSPQIFWKR
nr:PREDICTED: vomeronasal type-2 receptor 26 isoform X2 [Anolis carolinensis]|eukprot:XP_008113552.1 PREDICTED: vomeronasal type-2 receptor 26 isoform X2 [Anolis carolinensis]